MPDKRKQTGRPKMTEGKRTKKVTARFTEDEYKTISGLEETLGISKTDLVRERLLHGARLTIINAKELIDELAKIGTELGRSGNNINQFARYANTLNKKNVLSPQVMDSFNLLFAKNLENREALEITLRKIIRSLGR
ncbi:MAG: plasmid mobilization relaxosome protein MobC [Bacteroidetes bacterium]|nr:plasmid mobilization relaxosome protein MobC [Bacteroidota bacterium]